MTSKKLPWISGATLMNKYGLQPVEVLMTMRVYNLVAYRFLELGGGMPVPVDPSYAKPGEIETLLFNKSAVEEVFDEGENQEKSPKEALDEEVKDNKSDRKGLLPCPPGTKWDKIKITLLSNETVLVEAPHGEDKFSYYELDLADGRKKKGCGVLWVLFSSFAENQGFISGQNSEYMSNLTDNAKRLNTHLQQLFGIDESIYKAHYKKERGYRTKIIFSDATNVIS